MASTTSPTPRATTRRPRSQLQQALRLTRVEFVQMWRYRTAQFYVLAMPPLMVMIMLSVPAPEFLPGVDGATFTLVNMIVLLAPLVGLLHVSNLYAVRREQLVLKRLRVSGVPAGAIFGATAVSVTIVVLLQTALIVGAVGALEGTVPAAPVLLLVAVLAGAVMMTCFGAAFTRLTRNAESTQMTNVLPFLALLLLGGAMTPLDVFPEPVARIMWFSPLAPITDLVRSAYFGYDFFGGIEGAVEVGTGQLWVSAAPALLVTAVWVALALYLLRFVRWDPRQAK